MYLSEFALEHTRHTIIKKRKKVLLKKKFNLQKNNPLSSSDKGINNAS